MTIAEAMQNEEFSTLRVVYGTRWLVGETGGKWTVYEQGYRQKVRVAATADSESEAVAELLKG